MITLNSKEVKVEHFPDGTQRIVLDDCFYQKYNNITWKYEKEEELSALIYSVNHKVIFDYLFKSSYMPV